MHFKTLQIFSELKSYTIFDIDKYVVFSENDFGWNWIFGLIANYLAQYNMYTKILSLPLKLSVSKKL